MRSRGAWRVRRSSTTSSARPGNPAWRRSALPAGRRPPIPPRSPPSPTKLDADLVVVGPEDPLVAGVVDAVRGATAARAFGPRAAAARLEGSKAWMKDVLAAAGRPDRAPRDVRRRARRSRSARVPRHAARPLRDEDRRARGGQGRGRHRVDRRGARRGARVPRRRRVRRRRAARCVIEEGLTGPEVSLFASVRRLRRRTVQCARAPPRTTSAPFDGDAGPNTGGMGAYSPVPVRRSERRSTS